LVTIRIDFFVFETISAFRAIRRYFELIESQIGKVKDEEWDKLKELPVPRDEEEYQTEYVPTIEAHKHEFDKVLPRLVGYSFVMMLFSELEFRINGICSELIKRENVVKNLNDFRGNLIEKFSKFLRDANKPQLDNNEKDEIRDFIVIRNFIVHNNGFLNDSKRADRLRGIAKSKLHVEIVGKNTSERVNVTNTFCYSRIEFFITMFRRLFELLNFGPEFPIMPDDRNK